MHSAEHGHRNVNTALHWLAQLSEGLDACMDEYPLIGSVSCTVQSVDMAGLFSTARHSALRHDMIATALVQGVANSKHAVVATALVQSALQVVAAVVLKMLVEAFNINVASAHA
jgi:hypothetical protein